MTAESLFENILHYLTSILTQLWLNNSMTVDCDRHVSVSGTISSYIFESVDNFDRAYKPLLFVNFLLVQKKYQMFTTWLKSRQAIDYYWDWRLGK